MLDVLKCPRQQNRATEPGTSRSMSTLQHSDHLRATLRQQPMFRGLPAQEVDRLTALASLRELHKGEVMWEAGDTAVTLTMILRGHVKVVHQGVSGDRILEIFGPGEAVGAFAVYNRTPYPASAVAMEPSTILVLPAHEYLSLLERRPDLARSLIGELTRVHASLLGRIEGMTGHRVESRIAQVILSLAERMGHPGDDGTVIPVALSRLEIAELTGTTVETTIRVMARWGREGVVITHAQGFVVPSCDRLRAIADSRTRG